MKMYIGILMSSLCFILSASAFAEEHVLAAGGGYSHGANNYHNNNAYHDNGYNGQYYNHNNVWYGGSVNVNTWNDGVLYDDHLNDDTGMVVGVPEPGYYDPSCQTIDDCSTGTCVLVNTCDHE
jgi:hypothetical protein